MSNEEKPIMAAFQRAQLSAQIYHAELVKANRALARQSRTIKKQRALIKAQQEALSNALNVPPLRTLIQKWFGNKPQQKQEQKRVQREGPICGC